MKTKKMTITIKEDLLEKLKKYCDENCYKISTFIAKLIENDLNKK
jgi:metal-responsive CopG/Arc/MetJ family transcriptional regulator